MTRKAVPKGVRRDSFSEAGFFPPLAGPPFAYGFRVYGIV